MIFICFFSYKGAFIDDINHTGQVGTQLYMSPEQVVMKKNLSFSLQRAFFFYQLSIKLLAFHHSVL